MINFKNKKILVTGATGGIGREIVKKFISLEGNVVATGTNIEKLDLLKKDFTSLSSAMTGVHHQSRNHAHGSIHCLYLGLCGCEPGCKFHAQAAR